MSEEKKSKKDEKEMKQDIKQDKKNSEVKAGKKDIGAKEDVKTEKTMKEEVRGLEELPEDIRKRMEKRKAEVEQKSKKSKARKRKKKEKRIVTSGFAYIKSTYNNTVVSLTDKDGNVMSSASAGVAGFKGPKKSTPYAAQIITRIAVAKARTEFGLSEVGVFVKGVGTGRESAIRALNSNGLIVTSIKDVTPIPHNGCRQRKPRRV